MSQGVYRIVDEFEEALCRYTKAPYAIAVDNGSNALFLCLTYYKKYIDIQLTEITIPKCTYPSVPCEIIHAGLKVRFDENLFHCLGKKLKGSYYLYPTTIYDSALRFTYDMYKNGSFMCLSFTGPYKHLKLGKGGAILTDNYNAYMWFRRARFSGRREIPYHIDNFDMLGWNFYMMPEIAARGVLLMNQFYNPDGTPKENEDLELPYPDLSQFSIYMGETCKEQ